MHKPYCTAPALAGSALLLSLLQFVASSTRSKDALSDIDHRNGPLSFQDAPCVVQLAVITGGARASASVVLQG
jgi:hypothetical protein